MSRRAAYVAVALAALLLPPAVAQEGNGDRGFLTGFLEKNLSGVGREVRIEGFEGALSSRATIAEMTFADAEGVWLTIRDAAISWNRSALLRGRVEVAELSAGAIEIARKPSPAEDTGLPDPEARPFQLPELPVSVEIGSITADSVTIAEAVIGQPVAVSLSGALTLAGGEGSADLIVERIDGTEGSVTLDAAYENATRELDLTLALSEPEGGIAATLIGLPGRPAIDLDVAGTGAVTDYTARIRLASDGTERLAGEARFLEVASGDGPPARSFALDLGGDIAPLFAPDFRAFFGPDIRLAAEGARDPDGRTRLEALHLEAATVVLDGTFTLAADGLPEAFDLAGRIAAPDGAPVRLPVGGSPTLVDTAEIDVTFDATRGDAWSGSAELSGLSLGENRLGEARLSGEGTISRAAGDGDGRSVAARIELAARGIALAAPALADAVGPRADATATLSWNEGAPLQLSLLTAETDTGRFVLAGEVGALAEGLPFRMQGSATIGDLADFSALAARPLGGRIVLALNGTSWLLDDRFDLRAGGSGRDLRTGIAPLDRAIAGESRVSLDARRDETGITLRNLRLTTAEAELTAAGVARAGATDLTASGALAELGRVVPELSGPASFEASVKEVAPGAFDLKLDAEGPGGAVIGFEGRLEEADGGRLTADGRLAAQVARADAYAALAKRPIRGAVGLAAEGKADLTGMQFDGSVDLQGQDLAVGIDAVDRLLGGRVALDAAGGFARDLARLERFDLATAEAQVSASGVVQAGGTELSARARLAEVGRVVPGLTGPAALDATVEETAAGTYDVALDAEGPGAARIDFGGRVLKTDAGDYTAEGKLNAALERLEPYAALAKRPLRGAVQLAAEGRGSLDGNTFNGIVDLSGERLGVGLPTVDRLLGGRVTLQAAGGREDGTLTLRRFALDTAELTAEAAGSLAPDAGRIEGSARLRNVGLLAPDFAGPLSVQGSVDRVADGSFRADVAAEAPGNTTARITGAVAADASTVDLRFNGEAPLGLVNEVIAPRAVRGRASFDLAMAGRPGLEALSGRVTTAGARLVAPIYGVSVDDIGGNVTLGGSRAAIELSGAVEGGGRVDVGGSVGLAQPFDAALSIGLANAAFREAELFQTEVSGRIDIAGPLRNGARIAGALDIGETEVRVAATGRGLGDDLPGLRHLGEPQGVRLTRERAGFIEEAGRNGRGRGRPLALDLLIRAPDRIFIRGRGLDAELGGALRLTGTTAEVIPQGRFELIRGRLDILGRRLALDQGSARLEGSFDPYLRLVATTEAEEISVRVVVEGPASSPEIRFESSPELPEDEVLARLFFGRGLNEISPFQAARLASAVATLSGRGGGGVVERLRQNFGLDDLDVTTDEDGGAAVRAGRYISEKVYTEVTVGSEGKAEVSINLDLSRSLTVKGSVGSEGETGLGIFYERDY